MIKDKDMGKKLLESIETLNEAAYELYSMVLNDNERLADFVKTMQALLIGIKGNVTGLVVEEPALKCNLLVDNALATLEKLDGISEKKRKLGIIKNELIPEIGEAYVDLLFWGGCFPDPDAMFEYYNNQMKEFYPAPETDKGRYRYDLSVAVMANTDVEQVEKCLKSLNDAVPEELRCEYILFNDGAGEKVAKYFDDLADKNVKVINYKHRTNAPSVIYQLVEGKDVLFLTTENILSKTAVSNMMKCLTSDKKIGAVCPAFVEEDKLDDTESNEYLWHQKSELNTDVVLAPSNEILMPTMLGAYFPFMAKRYTEFSSKAMSLIGRRNGKLLYEAGDALAYRVHKEKDEDIVLEGIKQFERIMGINPMLDQDVDQDLLSGLDFENKEKRIDILGINSSFGINLLAIQDRVREESKNLRTNIYSLNEVEAYERDLEAIAKKGRFISDWDKDFDKCFPNARFDYIVMEKTNDKLLDLMLLLKLLERLKDGGSLAIHTAEEMPLSDYEPRKVVGDWQILYKQSDE